VKHFEARIMKLKFLSVLLLAIVAAVAYASLQPPTYDNAKPPTLPLPSAYEKALAFLGPRTNEFHCIRATVTNAFSSDGEWYFSFYSTNANARFPLKQIDVSFGGRVIEDNGYR
jgi:hypothetical protein